MYEVQPIEDAGPHITFGILRLLRIFVPAASPGIDEGKILRNKDRP